MSNELIDDCPRIARYAIGDCEMLEREYGTWLSRETVQQMLEWVMEHDDRDVMLQKLAYLKDLAI